ncbi:hypothetical protein DINM_000978 [Dirofilaria immitis]|nr:hypothetical protein [Dirofilaria immitis]
MVLSNACGILQDYLSVLFYKYGLIVSYNPRPFVLIPIIITFFLSFGVLTMNVEDDLRFLYSPINSPARFEYSIHKAFTGDSINSSYVAVAVESSNNLRNLLRKEIAAEIVSLNEFVLNNLTVNLNGQVYNFGKDICIRTTLCPLSNTIVQFFFNAFWNEKLWDDPRVRLDYPFYTSSRINFSYRFICTETAEVVGGALENALKEYLAINEQSLIKTSMFSFSMLKNEMNKNALYTFPFISLTILLLVTFTILSCMTGDWVTSKPLEALMGVLSSSFAIISATGFMFLMGTPFVSQVTVMPFLALAIGVDDTYVMLGAWQDTRRNLPPSKRMALSLQEAGSAITVTSITSMLSFGIGSFSTTPAISIFCRFIAMAIIFDWFYQLTFFAGVMALGGKREAVGYHCVFVWKKMSKEIIEKKITRISLIVIYGLYILGAFYGCSLLRPNLTPSRLLVDDSPLAHYLTLAETKIWSEGVVGRIYVNNAPDFATDPKQIKIILRLADDLENTAYSLGKNSTQFWLREYLHYRQFFESNDEDFYYVLESFLNTSFNSHWNAYLSWTQHPTKPNKRYVNRFFFTTAFKIKDWKVRTALLLQWRNITSHYAKYEALVFDENNFYSDQMLELQSTTLSSLSTAIVAMIIVCVLFIADSTIVFWVVFAMISMDVGIAGYLSFGS